MNSNAELGILAEKIAEKFYLADGYSLLARNFRVPAGELDLVLRKGAELLFVEVKGRSEFWADEAWQTRWRKKKRKLLRATRIFLARFPEIERDADEIRLEIVFVTQGRVRERYEDESFF